MRVAIAINCARVASPRATFLFGRSIAAPRSPPQPPRAPPQPPRRSTSATEGSTPAAYLTNRLSVWSYKPTVGPIRLTRLTRKASVMQLTELEARRHAAAPRSGEISYIDVGTGPVALFVHGIATNAYLWRHVIGALAGQRRCIAVDLPLHGRSPVTAGQDLSVAALAAGLEDFCDTLGLDRIDLVANDTGGAIAQVFAARHPERLATLTLTNCDTSDNLPPEAFKPTVDLARTGNLAPSAVALFADP